MSVLVRCASLRRLQVVLGLALMALAFSPSASAAAQLDTVIASGGVPGGFSVDVSAQSGTSGQNPSGHVSLHLGGGLGPSISGPVTCLSVTGNTAVINLLGTETLFGMTSVGIVTLELVDNGGSGQDIFSFSQTPRAATDCSPLMHPEFSDTFLFGRVMVFDAPDLPTSKDRCTGGGWRDFGVFKNQGDCVSFVATHGKNQPG